MKPLKRDCKKLCDLFPCSRTECHRKKGWYAGSNKLIMFNDTESVKWDYVTRKRNYNELTPVKFYY